MQDSGGWCSGVDIGIGREGRALIRARLWEDGVDIGGGREEGL